MSNNRSETRLESNQTIYIEVHSAYPASEDNCKLLICHSVDISANGIKAHIDEKVPLNAIYQLCVEIHEPFERLYLAAQVKWITEAEDKKGFYVGLLIFESDDTDIEKWKLHIANQLSL